MLRHDSAPAPKKRPPLFWWILANTLAIAFAISAWVICLNLFRDPTHPKSYELMLKVGRIAPPAAFTRDTMPSPLEENDYKELETRFQPIGNEALEALSKELLREYLTNYKKPKLLTFVTGEFRVMEVRTLSEDDFLSPGIAVKAQALARPDAVADPLPYPVFIECLISSENASDESFAVGDTLMLEKQRDCAALIHVDKCNFEDRQAVLATVLPLNAGTRTLGSSESFTIAPPAKANPAASLPAIP